jgi:hypothetical protein
LKMINILSGFRRWSVITKHGSRPLFSFLLSTHSAVRATKNVKFCNSAADGSVTAVVASQLNVWGLSGGICSLLCVFV